MHEIAFGNLKTGCFPLIAVSFTDASLISGISPDGADIVELRVDMFREISPDYVIGVMKRAKQNINQPLLTTVRAFNEGGAVRISDSDRESLYSAAMDYSDAIDIEINSDVFSSVVTMARQSGKTVIGSFHDFQKTPGLNEMVGIIKRGKSLGADLVKIAVMPDSADDLRTLTDLTLRYYDQGLVVIGMGELGMASRIFLPLIGSAITFAALDISTAPGQLSLNEVRAFLAVLKK